MLPVYMMDHSGLSVSTTDTMFRAFDSAGWDWGRVGLAFASAESIREAFGVERISRELREQVEDVLRAEVSEYDAYLRGEAYCYAIETADGEVLDSCCGLVGYDHAIAEARAAAEALASTRVRPPFDDQAPRPITHAGDRRPAGRHAGGRLT